MRLSVARGLRPLFVAIAMCTLLASRAEAAIAPEGDTTQIKSAHAGDAYRGVIVVRNTGKQAVDVKVYQTDYAFNAAGQNFYGAPGKLPRSNALWLKLDQEQITLAGGERGKFEYQVQVPDDIRLAGTYWS